MKQLQIRPKLKLTAFQWDGAEVPGYERLAVGLNELQNEKYNLRVVMLGTSDEEVEEAFASPGDWIVTNGRGSFVWPDATFAETYEVIGEVS